MRIESSIQEYLIEIEVRKYTPRTIKGYRNNLGLFLRFCTERAGIEEVEDLTLGVVKQFMLGHYSAGFTLDTYTHVTAQMQQAAADKMGGFMENALPGESAPEPEPPKGKVIPFERVG